MDFLALLGQIQIDGVEGAIRNISELGGQFDDAAQTAGRFGERLSAAGERMSAAGASMTVGVTAPLTAIGVAAMNAAGDADEATGRIQAQLGITKEQAQALTGSAQELWAEGFGGSVQEAADNIAVVGQNMQDLTQDQIVEATRHATIFADTFGEDIPASTAAANVMMKNFGLSSTEAFDLMTAGMQKGGNYSGELLDTMREYSPQFAAMGMSADEMMNVLISGAEAGAFNMDKVGDAVKEFNLRAADGSESTAEAYKAIGLNATEMGAAIAGGGEKAQGAYQATIAALAAMEDPVQQNIAGVALFGTQWEDLQSDVVLAMSSTKDQLGDVKGATDAAGAALKDNFRAQFTTQIRQLGLALQPIGQILMDMASRALPVLSRAIENISIWFGSLTASQQKWIVILGLAAAAIGPLLLILGSMATTIGGLITTFAAASAAIRAYAVSHGLAAKATALGTTVMKLFTGAVRMLGVALKFLATNPIGLAITAIAGLVAIGIYVYKNWETLGPKITAVFTSIGDWMSRTWTRAKEITEVVFKAIGAFFGFIFRSYVALIRLQLNLIFTVFRTIFTAISNFTKAIFNGIKNFLVNTWSSIKNTLANLVNGIKNGFINGFNAIKTRVTNIISGLKTSISGIVRDIGTAAGQIPGKIGNAIKNKVSDATGAMTDLASGLIKRFKSALGINSPSTIFFDLAGNVVSGLINGLKDSNLLAIGKRLFADFAEGAAQSIGAVSGYIAGGASKVTKGAKKAGSFITRKIGSLGTNTAPGYFKGGVFTGPSVIRVAENAKTPVEAAIPLSGRYMYPFADAIGQRIAGAAPGAEPEPIKIVIEVPVQLDGREIARATAPELDVELARRKQRDARARGRRL